MQTLTNEKKSNTKPGQGTRGMLAGDTFHKIRLLRTFKTAIYMKTDLYI